MAETITIYHSADADDAFMFYGLASGEVRHPRIDFRHELCDIESLNHLALKAELKATAVSVHAYSYIADHYSILDCGASLGGPNYGPRILSREALSLEIGKELTVAVPGTLTSATLALRLFAREKGYNLHERVMHFDEIMTAVSGGEVQAGLIIHEGQITYMQSGLLQVADLGQWWWQKEKLPLPLGINVVRKDLSPEVQRAFASVLWESIAYALEHRKEALDYAMQFSRGLSREEVDTFVRMYVNEATLSLGQEGKEAIARFLGRAHEARFVEQPVQPEYILRHSFF